MNETKINKSFVATDSGGSDMFFMYTMVVVMFIGLVGHLVALLIFSKPLFKRRPVTVYHVNMSAAALLLSFVGNTLSLVNVSKRNELERSNFVTMCRLSVGLEVSGITVYALISVMMLGHSYFMTSYHVTTSSFYVPRRVTFTAAGVFFSWICGILLGIPPSWLMEDFVVFEDRVICQLSWVGKGSEKIYWILLVILWICALLLSLVTHAFTRRLVSGSPPHTSMSNASVLQGQIRSNKLNNRLVFSLFIFILPYLIFGFFTTIVGYHFLPTFLTLVLEMMSKSYVIQGPFIFLAKSRTYRAILGNILSNGPFVQVGPASNLSNGSRTTQRSNRRAGANPNGTNGRHIRRPTYVTPMGTREGTSANSTGTVPTN